MRRTTQVYNLHDHDAEVVPVSSFFLVNIPDQVQEELSRVMEGRQVTVEDRQRLPFTDAVIHETQRKANIIPLSLLHRTSQDVTFKGFFIEKVCLVLLLR